MLLNVILSEYNKSCINNDWLFKANVNQWTISPYADSTRAQIVYYLYSEGYLFYAAAVTELATYPTTYLLPDIKIIDGIGTEGQPFILSK